jgi:predicted DNA binding CopG/RHH family protein
MAIQTTEAVLDRPITTRLTRDDYEAVLQRARAEEVNQTTLIRLAVRQYLKKSEMLIVS